MVAFGTSRSSLPRVPAHPIIRSAEPGEDWSWCYLDELAFYDRSAVGRSRLKLSERHRERYTLAREYKFSRRPAWGAVAAPARGT